MEIRNFFSSKSILLFIILSFYGCKGQKEEKKNNAVEQHTNTGNSYFQFQKVEEKKDGTTFKFADLKLELIPNEGTTNLLINNEEYLTKLTLDSPDINIWYYKYNDEKVILIEGMDYYSSVFYAYHLYNKQLFYLGNFTIDQPNIENEKPYKKDFKINIEKNKLIIENLLDGQLKGKNIFSDKTNEIKKKQATIGNSPIGSWSTDCENVPNLIIQENKSFFYVVYNQLTISMIKLKESTNSELLYRLDKKPEDMGSIGLSLDWDNYLNKKEIAKIKIIDDNHIEFSWIGFYNDKTNKRDFIESDITSDNKPVILTKCKD
ncbi:hypothetical protein [Chryseobacterium polytrichastri]|uniref:Uncharacterized protein n=1 Tax=Chryseobacterium polytrichastri TaxID=1302687 RepID=A0A1M7JPQ5_9FLAO|nr:hypothetical protein [Chryseobacterium polytrichastri]SHM55070.1 hypothetical protein SAMN05444267_105411 [Chryseobacterium polytrichastri]